MIALPLRTALFYTMIVYLLPASLFAQFRGGNNDGAGLGIAASQPLGRNIFTGGADDGIAFRQGASQPLGRNIFTGGADDGIAFRQGASQPLGRNIFTGGADDGIAFRQGASQPLGRNIFTGGADDGIAFRQGASQPLGRNIFAGGSDDGWAMAFASIKESPLPLLLTDFNGRWQANDALLTWKTATEVNTAHFELERSFDGNTFARIQRLTAAGQSTIPRSYNYTDVNIRKLVPPGTSTIYYRLRSVDKNGDATYSGIVMLKPDVAREVEYAVYPNPAKDIVTITASQLLPPENAFLRLADVSGKVLLLQKMVAPRQQISVSTFPNGTYFLQLIAADQVVYTQKIIIRK